MRCHEWRAGSGGDEDIENNIGDVEDVIGEFLSSHLRSLTTNKYISEFTKPYTFSCLEDIFDPMDIDEDDIDDLDDFDESNPDVRH